MNPSPNYMTNRNNENREAMMVEESDSFGALPTPESLHRNGGDRHSTISSAAARTSKFRQQLLLEGDSSRETPDLGSAVVSAKAQKEKKKKKKKKSGDKKKKESQNRPPQDGEQEKQGKKFASRFSKPHKLTPATSNSSNGSRSAGRTEVSSQEAVENGVTNREATQRPTEDTKRKKKGNVEVEKLAEKLRADRIRNGQCPTCGILLYKVKVKGVFKRVMQRKPISLEGQVLNGKCIMCSKQKGDNAAQVVVSAVTSDIHDIDKKEKDMYRMDHGYDAHSDGVDTGNLSTLVQYTAEPRAPFNAADLTGSRQGSARDAVSRYVDESPNNQKYTTGKLQEEDMERESMEEFACVPNSRDNSVYQGGFDHLGAREGPGELYWSNGDRYSGDFARNARNGQGSMFFSNGGEYVGVWCNDKMHGAGTRRYANGDVYTGNWIGGFRHGEGQYFFADGSLYTGSFQNGNFHGFGRYYYADGPCFEGTFARGLRSGKGKFQAASGEIDVQRYSRDQRVGEGVRWSVDRHEAWRLFEDGVRGHVTELEAAQIVTNCECDSWETMVG